MSNVLKNQQAILEKLQIEALNPMQEAARLAIHSYPEVILRSPTGTGKTLAFLLPVLSEIDRTLQDVQALILAPSRELAIQIEQVARDMATGVKIQVVYGGTSFSKDKRAFTNPPQLLIGTPGRVSDHLRRHSFSIVHLKSIVLDEYDKSLEIGFEPQMLDITRALPMIQKKVFTSATNGIEVPPFMELKEPHVLDYLDEKIEKLQLKRVISPEKDKLPTLVELLNHLGNQPGIIFCNFKDSIRRVSDFLTEKGISHGCFYGGLEQRERERTLIKFRNGTHQIILATDLAARGLDIPEIKFIIHYHLPTRPEEFTHRNGRTARMHNEGTAYVLQWVEEELPEFIEAPAIEKVKPASELNPSDWTTLYISGGRQDKISKGDIAGLFFKKGNLEKGQLGIIELKKDCAFAAVTSDVAERLVEQFDGERLKRKKVRVEIC